MQQTQTQSKGFPCPEGDLDDLIFADVEYCVSER